jgi:O-antigen ligase
MAKTAISDSSKSTGQIVLEHVLLFLCLCVIALRATYTESPGVQTSAMPANINDSIYSLSISTILILSFAVWFIITFCSRRFSYRLTGIEIGLCLFCTAAIVGISVASNKRAAITNFVTLLAPVLMAVLLVQILDTQAKVKLLLAVIAALGVVSAYQCAEQYFFSNKMTIEQYVQNREAVLKSLGIGPDSFAQFLFEHRLFTKGVRGFFTTSNSAGSFALLAIFAGIGLFVDKFRNRTDDASGPVRLVICGIGVLIVVFGFFITRSRGAMAAAFAASGMFMMYLLFGNWIRKYKKVIFIICVLLFIAVVCIVVRCGITHDRLPGGNSMLVRCQYWRGAAQMYADHPVTGVGGGNFGSFYTHYKSPSALESVADPHNIVLSIITQYGPLGLLGFLAVFSLPLCRASSGRSGIPSPKDKKSARAYTKLTIPLLIVISAALLLVRPVLSPLPDTGSPEERYAGIIVLYIIPVIVFNVGCLLLIAGRVSIKDDYINIAAAGLFCACLGVLIHNLIDFAIFEPSVFTIFWAVMASIIAMDYHRKSRQQLVRKPALFSKLLVAVGGLVLIWAYFIYAFVPVKQAGADIKLAMQGIGYTHEYLDKAAQDDNLDPTALNLNGRLYLQDYSTAGKQQPALLEKAVQCFFEAVQRDSADFKNYEKLSQVYNLLGDNKKAYDWGLAAAKRYPGSGRLQFNLAEIAEKMGKTSMAIEHYKEAVNIEDKYRNQFRKMYPGRDVVSRLGEEKYERAKKRIQHLSQLSR